MDNGLQIFNNPEFGQIRTVTIDDEPWFVGKDVATALGYENPQKAVRTHVDSEDKGMTEMDTPGGRQELAVINESGLYSLIMSSKLESAKRFKHWVTGEVLPALRKTGSYGRCEKRSILSVEDAFRLAELVNSTAPDKLPAVREIFLQAGVTIPEPHTDKVPDIFEKVFNGTF